MKVRYLLKNAKFFSQGVFHLADVFLSDGKIVSIGDGVSPSNDTIVIDISNMVLFPGFVDVHVHLREPGFSYKETIRSGTLAAAHGGFAHIAAMPNLNPVPDCAESLALQRALIEKDALVHVHPYGAITVGEKGERLADLAGMAPDVIAFSDDGRGVQSESMMRQAMAECRHLGKILAAHCEDNALLRGGYIHDGAYARAHGHRGICSESEWGQIARDVKPEEMMENAMRRAKTLGKIIVAHCEDNSLLRGGYIHDGVYAARHGHAGICSESEWRPIRRDLALAAKTGASYHVCHISCAESVALIREAKKAGIDVTCETAPHYLLLTENELEEDGRFKMNPPLRDQADRDALIEGLLDGTIDMLITDHAPHSREEKSKGLEKSAMGVVGLETSFAASYTHLVKKGILPLEKLVELMHTSPMRRFGCGTEIAVGQVADLTVFDLNKTYTVDPEAFLTMGRATPFAGTCLTGACKLTMIGGEIVWKEDML